MGERPTEKVGALIRKARERRGMTQLELGRSIGTSPPYISMLECGLTKGVSGARLTEIADALGLKTAELDEWLASAGHIPERLKSMLLRHPKRWKSVYSVLAR